MVGAAIGSAIDSAVRENHNFNDCMQARGWRVADGQPVSAPSMAGKLALSEQPALATTIVQPPLVLASTSTPTVATRNSFLVRAAVVSPEMASAVHLDLPCGIMILSVGIGGAAMTAGLLGRDVILDFNGSPVNGQSDMQGALSAIGRGDTVIATIWREGPEKAVSVRF
jgi:hypothetical protein